MIHAHELIAERELLRAGLRLRGLNELNRDEMLACERLGIPLERHHTGVITQDEQFNPIPPGPMWWGPEWVTFVSCVAPRRSGLMGPAHDEVNSCILVSVLRAIYQDPERINTVCSTWRLGGDEGLQDLLHVWGLVLRDHEGRVLIPTPEGV